MPGLDKLERELMRFVRAFGLHHGDRTPCGEPIRVSQAHALTELAHAPLSQVELARRLRLDRSVISRLATRSRPAAGCAAGPIPRTGAPSGFVLTAKGRAAAQRLAVARRARLATLLDAIPEHERATVIAALSTLAGSLDRPPERAGAR